MAIDPTLLIAAPLLQDYFVDNVTGAAMSGGIITCYRDNARTTLKNWYYQTGAPGAYSYLPLPNPMTLSDVGTIEDANGNDVIPYWYPYDESNSTINQAYYVKVVNSDLQNQFTRANFPFNPNQTTPTNTVTTDKNLIINNEFWRNVVSVNATTLAKSVDIDGVDYYYTTIAPSQHDGMPVMSDIQFFKNQNGAVDTLTFGNFVDDSFADQVIGTDAITPEYYLNFECSQTGSEASKYIQIPIQLHVNSLSGVQNCTITIAAMALSGNPEITLGIYQYLGDGVSSPLVSVIETIPLTNSWQKYTSIPFTMPSAQGVTLGDGGDDCLYLQIGLPAGGTGICNLNLAIPGVYLSDNPPTNDFQTYDEINAIISSPRIGDVRTSMNEFYSFGWVPMNDGTIGYNSDTGAAYHPTARNNADTWPLYSLLWNKFKDYTISTTNILAQLIDSTGANVAYGSSAIGDFSANKSLTLTQTMGKVILGTVPLEQLISAYKTTFTATNDSGNLLMVADNNMQLFNGMPIIFSTDTGTLPSNINPAEVYYVAQFNGTTSFYVSTSFANAMAANGTLTGNVLVWVDDGTIPNNVIAAFNGTFEGEYAHTQLLAELATHNHAFGTHQSSAGTGDAADTFLSGEAINNVYANAGVPIFNTGSSTPFNVTQPGNFFNIYMKL